MQGGLGVAVYTKRVNYCSVNQDRTSTLLDMPGEANRLLFLHAAGSLIEQWLIRGGDIQTERQTIRMTSLCLIKKIVSSICFAQGFQIEQQQQKNDIMKDHPTTTQTAYIYPEIAQEYDALYNLYNLTVVKVVLDICKTLNMQACPPPRHYPDRGYASVNNYLCCIKSESLFSNKLSCFYHNITAVCNCEAKDNLPATKMYSRYRFNNSP